MSESKREKTLNLVGFGLVMLCFVLSLGHIFGRYLRPTDTAGKTTIRFAHWQLESGLREAYTRIAAAYMQLHPDVYVEQMPVPTQIWANWLRTQLIGGTAPELIEIEGYKGETNEMLANYFEPVTPYLGQPNPYNKDNDLADVPWRDTFIDGLSHSYNQELLQNYGIPSSMFTVRVFYNRSLWRAIFGTETLPSTYEEMVEDCRRAATYHDANNQPIIPIGGAAGNAPFLVQRLFCSQTQRLFYSLARPDELYPSNDELALAFLSGRWDFHSPAVHDGLEIARGIGKFFPPGFLQLKREDALFLFSQGRALMTVTGSWDAPSLRSQAPFEVGVFDVPVPDSSDPHYGHNTVGRVSGAGMQMGLSFGMIKQDSAEKQARVIDFLRFLTSRNSNRMFSEYSGWLPAIVGVQPSAEVRPFLPRTGGYPSGFNMGISVGDDGGQFGPETGQVEETNLYQLFDADGSPEAYTRAIAEPMRPAVIRDFNNIQRGQLEVITGQDTTLAAYRGLSNIGGQTGNWAAKVSELDELQTQEEIAVAIRRRRLGQIGVTLEK